VELRGSIPQLDVDGQPGSTHSLSGEPIVSEGIVYILTNAAMPGFIKIGLTQQDDVSLRVKGPDAHRFSQCFLDLCDK